MFVVIFGLARRLSLCWFRVPVSQQSPACECMHGDAWTDAWMDGCMHACIQPASQPASRPFIQLCMSGCMRGCMDAWMHGCMTGALSGAFLTATVIQWLHVADDYDDDDHSHGRTGVSKVARRPNHTSPCLHATSACMHERVDRSVDGSVDGRAGGRTCAWCRSQNKIAQMHTAMHQCGWVDRWVPGWLG